MTCISRPAFGLAANAVALKAIHGEVRQRDYINLAEMLLTHAGADEGARQATLTFLQNSRHDMPAAGKALQDFVLEWSSDIDPRRPSEVLAGIEIEAKTAPWRERADLQ